MVYFRYARRVFILKCNANLAPAASVQQSGARSETRLRNPTDYQTAMNTAMQVHRCEDLLPSPDQERDLDLGAEKRDEMKQKTRVEKPLSIRKTSRCNKLTVATKKGELTAIALDVIYRMTILIQNKY